jgi:excisionase family DNA binding protein
VATPKTLNTNEAAKKLGVHRSTLLRWFAQKRIGEVRRDRNNWRVFTMQDLERIEKEVRRDATGSGR